MLPYEDHMTATIPAGRDGVWLGLTRLGWCDTRRFAANFSDQLLARLPGRPGALPGKSVRGRSG